MTALWRTTIAELRREVYLARTYRVDFLADQALYTVGFLLLSGLFYLVAGGEYSRPEILGLLVGYLTWRVADGTLLRLVRSTANDAQWGTLEQLVLGPQGFGRLQVGRALAAFVYHTARALLIAVIAIPMLRLSPVLLPGEVLLFLLTQIGAWGVGFLLVGLHLVTKNVAAITIGMSTALLFLTGALAPLSEGTMLYTLAQFLPLTTGIALLRQMLVDGTALSTLTAQPPFYWLLANSTAYLLAGLAVLGWGERNARRQGSLAHY